MRLKNFLFIVGLLAAGGARGAELSHYDCAAAHSEGLCRIELRGEVKADDRLFIARVHDRDRLLFRGRVLGSTGSFLGREFQAGFLPRIYPLSAIEGESNPVLFLETKAGLTHAPGIPSTAYVAVVDASFPLRRILAPALLEVLGFIVLCALTFYLIVCLRHRQTDGWIYPRDEMRWFLGAACGYLLLRHEVSELFVPLFWNAAAHLFAQRLSLFIWLWSLTTLFIHGRFSDRSSIEREHPRSPARALERFANLSFVAALAALAQFPALSEHNANMLLLLPLAPLALSFGRAIRETEWRRVLKRSSASPLLFHLGLLLIPPAAATVIISARREGGGQNALEYTGWVVVMLFAARMRNVMRTEEKSRRITSDCRSVLIGHAFGSARLQALCEFVADEWGAARVSVISVDDEIGFVLASAGPEAIPLMTGAEPRRLGPFLRRVCKQGQMLYAPVAEELGHDLQSQGLKHSSLAIPLSQEGSVCAVLCMMADEGERIPPVDAAQLSLVVEALSLEVLSAAAQHVAENMTENLLAIARRADALAVENLDHWGNSLHSGDEETRVVLGGDCIPIGPFFEELKNSPLLGKTWAAYRAEIRAHWTALAMSYGFIPKDNREDFWVISPRTFSHPFLQALGPERVALLLASALDRHARALLAKDGFGVLGFCGVRLVTSSVRLRRSSWHDAAVEIASEDFSLLLDLRQRATPGTVAYKGDISRLVSEGGNGFACRSRRWDGDEKQVIYSILSATADKKDLRKMENQALEKIRELNRKAA